MKYDEILEVAIQNKVKYPSFRLGQCVWNTFSKFIDTKGYPDCFHYDEKIQAFLTEAKKILEEESND